MLPIHKLVWHEWRARGPAQRVPEPSEAMDDPEQIRAYIKAYEWGGPTSALQLHHLRQLSTLIRPGDTVLDLACGPGPLLLELAPLYPDCQFIGADLSPRMLQVLRETCAARGISNVQTLCEDVRDLPSIAPGSVDMVITTSALHHLPDLECLEQVFARVESVLKADGGLYIFDFGQVRSPRARELLVADVARRAPAVTATDYAHSLNAAFSVDAVLAAARRQIRRPLKASSSRFVDFFYFIRSDVRSRPAEAVLSYINRMQSRCDAGVRLEGFMLAHLQVAR
jgi:arsenite methyltransferase